MAIKEKLKTTPPRLICLAALLINLALNAIWPLVSIPNHVRYIAGNLLIFGSLLAMPSILTKFRRMNTTFDVRKSSSAFIADGLYRFSRNPSYVVLVPRFIGLGVVLSNLWGSYRPPSSTGVPVCRRVATILEIWSVFHTKMALDTKLKQLALFMICW